MAAPPNPEAEFLDIGQVAHISPENSTYLREYRWSRAVNWVNSRYLPPKGRDNYWIQFYTNLWIGPSPGGEVPSSSDSLSILFGERVGPISYTPIIGSGGERELVALSHVDTDGDGVPNEVDIDDDGDTMPDEYEVAHGLDPIDAYDEKLDKDGDGLSSKTESVLGTKAGAVRLGWRWQHGWR